MKEKKDKWEMRKKGKKRKRERKERRGQNILKNYRVTMKIVNTKYGILN